MKQVVIVPGNGCSNVLHSNWYGWLHGELQRASVRSVCVDMPDPLRARRDRWLPFLEGTLQADADTILVGHSSGAQATLRYAETHALRAAVLVSATYSDLGDADERSSGYYPNADSTQNRYDFAAMRRNCAVWHQFHSDDDPFIPVAEAERIRGGLGLSSDDDDADIAYHLLPGRSHFFDAPFPELLATVLRLYEEAE